MVIVVVVVVVVRGAMAPLTFLCRLPADAGAATAGAAPLFFKWGTTVKIGEMAPLIIYSIDITYKYCILTSLFEEN